MSENTKTECVTLWVTPTVAAELKIAKDNDSLRDEIIKRFVRQEVSWMESEMRDVDDATIRYRAKLLAIRDEFQKGQDSYCEEIEAIYKKASDTFSRLDSVSKPLSEKAKTALEDIKKVSSAIDYINVDRLEKLLNLVDRYNSMSDDEKALIQSLIAGKK